MISFWKLVGNLENMTWNQFATFEMLLIIRQLVGAKLNPTGHLVTSPNVHMSRKALLPFLMDKVQRFIWDDVSYVVPNNARR